MKSIFSRIIAVIALAAGLAACDNVPAGYVGVKVDKYGDTRGVQNEVVGTGRYWAGPNTDYYLFPTFTQNEVWSRSSNGDQSITFQDKDGQSFNADFGLAYSIKRENAALVFQKYRKGIDEISDVFLRTMLRDALNERASTKGADELMGGKISFINEVEQDVIKRAAVNGITVESISVIGGFRLPQKITEAIDAKLQATQDAMKVENELRRTKAQAEKDVAAAEAQVRVAKAEAEAIALRGKALDANPGVLKQQWIEKWNGALPSTVTGQGTDLILNVNK